MSRKHSNACPDTLNDWQQRQGGELGKGALPANGALAIRGTFRHWERLPHLRLGQTQRQPSQLERFRKLLDLVQINAVHHVTVRLVYSRLICTQIQVVSPNGDFSTTFSVSLSTLYSLGDSSRRSSSPSECSSSDSIGRGDETPPNLWCTALAPPVNCEEWLGWADKEDEEELLVPWLDMWCCWWLAGLFEAFAEVAVEEVVKATVLPCSTGPFVIVSSPFDEVVSLMDSTRCKNGFPMQIFYLLTHRLILFIFEAAAGECARPCRWTELFCIEFGDELADRDP